MKTLLLIKHSQPQIDATAPALEWSLSAEGRRRCGDLAKAMAAYTPARIVSSTELKARQTARLLAEHLGIDCLSADGLHEHDRRNVGLLSPDAFQQSVRDLFAQPAEKVFGLETADQALQRFAGALDAIIAACTDECLAVVTHGTVLSLYVAQHCRIDGFALWQQLHLPSLVVLAMPERTLLQVVPDIAPTA